MGLLKGQSVWSLPALSASAMPGTEGSGSGSHRCCEGQQLKSRRAQGMNFEYSISGSCSMASHVALSGSGCLFSHLDFFPVVLCLAAELGFDHDLAAQAKSRSVLWSSCALRVAL